MYLKTDSILYYDECNLVPLYFLKAYGGWRYKPVQSFIPNMGTMNGQPMPLHPCGKSPVSIELEAR